MHRHLACFALVTALAAHAQEATPPAWSVNSPPGPKTEATIDTRTGTWMAVDVSPDGRTLVFDLLGDLYLLPIAGGEAKPLTHSMAWEMQPRFSPDGKQIAFISDAGGGDNVWVMGADGSGARAVTQEKTRLLGNPVWHPGGQYIAARKHFVGTRSLGSGEIWLYHVDGGKANAGVQLNEKPNWQKDRGEPALSPDGRWLYWSQDTTPGDDFEYNKNSRAEIFRIYRQSLDDGSVEPFVTGAGGAIRPQPAPDGKQLAFVRRVDGISTLFVKDLVSGRERAVWGPLTRDMQESWSVHGVYPGFAWLPGSREVVIWAGGQLWRVDVAKGSAAAIPFHVSDTRELRQPVRPPAATDVAADAFDVKQLRWAEVAPDGQRVVFGALGSLYLRDLKQGQPQRIATPAGAFAYYPSFSRDGKQLVYASWHDDELGRIRLRDLASGKDTVLTPEPGTYTAPRLSPDGRWVAYTKVRGGHLTAPWGGQGAGLYVAPVDGRSPPQRLTTDGEAPQWSAGSDAVFFTRRSRKDEVDTERSLVRLRLADRVQTVVATSQGATEFALSPDGRWLGFVEGFKAHVVSLPQTGKPVALAPGMEALPVRTLASDAGQYLHWSGDSQRLHHMQGHELVTTPLAAGANATRQPLGFKHASDTPQGAPIALVGARLVTMGGERSDEVIDDGTVVVHGARIIAIGPRASTPVPAGATPINVQGATIVPGFIDAHWHGAMAEAQMVPQRSWVDYASLAFGLTTLHDPSNRSGDIFTHAEMQRAGLVTGPRIYSTGAILYGAKGDLHAKIDTLDDALMHLKRMKAAGAISVKSYNQPRRDQRQMILEAARQTGMMVVPEGGSLFQMNMTMLIDGHTSIEHALPVAQVYDDVKQLWRQAPTGYTPTLGVAYGGLDGEHYWYARTDVWRHPLLARYVPRGILQSRAVRRETAPEEDFNVLTVARTAHELAQVGVKANIGAHGQREGLAAHWELWTFAAGGMSPLEALQTATINPARQFGLEQDLGSLAVGKLADLVVIQGDVLADIRQSDRIGYVMQNGRLYALPGMDEVAPRQRLRAAFFFEGDGADTPVEIEGEAHTRCVGH